MIRLFRRRYTFTNEHFPNLGAVVARFWTARSASAFANLVDVYQLDVRFDYTRPMVKR